MKSLIVLAVFLAIAAATEKGKGDDDYGYGYPVSYAPVYTAKAVDSYAYKLPQYKSDYNFKTYMPVVKYVAVKSVPFYGPTMAFYPKSYAGGYTYGGGGGGYGGGGGHGGGGYGGGMMGGYY